MRFIRIPPVFLIRKKHMTYDFLLDFLWKFLKEKFIFVFKRDLSEFFWNHCSKKADDLWILLEFFEQFYGNSSVFGNILWFICFCWSEKFFLNEMRILHEFFFEERKSPGIRKSLRIFIRIIEEFPEKKTCSIWKVRIYLNCLWIFFLKNADKFFKYFNQNTNLD